MKQADLCMKNKERDTETSSEEFLKEMIREFLQVRKEFANLNGRIYSKKMLRPDYYGTIVIKELE
jgi:hypothetical protein